jgi:hypothetical protein
MVKTILDKKKGKILFSTDGEYECLKNEVIAPFNLNEFMVNPIFDFENQTYIETATEEEIESYKIQFKISE